MSDLNKHLIDSVQSNILAQEYETSNYAQINSRRPSSKPDAKTFTYDLEVLQDYINLVREEMELLGIKNKGIKISLGKYPEGDFDKRLNPLFKGYQTIFFSAENLSNAVEDNTIGDSTSAKAKGIEDLPILDFGQLCPP
jgi:hypothetical protein